MKNIAKLENKINELVEQFICGLDEVDPEQLGLDGRIGNLYCNKDYIVVDKAGDRFLKYYGGFEYIPDDERKEFSGYVIYPSSNSRVKTCLERFYDDNEDDNNDDNEE